MGAHWSLGCSKCDEANHLPRIQQLAHRRGRRKHRKCCWLHSCKSNSPDELVCLGSAFSENAVCARKGNAPVQSRFRHYTVLISGTTTLGTAVAVAKDWWGSWVLVPVGFFATLDILRKVWHDAQYRVLRHLKLVLSLEFSVCFPGLYTPNDHKRYQNIWIVLSTRKTSKLLRFRSERGDQARMRLTSFR